MKRDQFITTLTLGAGALCAGCLLSCHKEDTPQKDTDALLKIDLSSNLLDIGQAKTDKGIYVVRVGNGTESYSFRAAEAACSFSGDTIQYIKATTRFTCPVHGSIFNY